jgi:hypothetical protein
MTNASQSFPRPSWANGTLVGQVQSVHSARPRPESGPVVLITLLTSQRLSPPSVCPLRNLATTQRALGSRGSFYLVGFSPEASLGFFKANIRSGDVIELEAETLSLNGWLDLFPRPFQPLKSFLGSHNQPHKRPDERSDEPSIFLSPEKTPEKTSEKPPEKTLVSQADLLAEKSLLKDPSFNCQSPPAFPPQSYPSQTANDLKTVARPPASPNVPAIFETTLVLPAQLNQALIPVLGHAPKIRAPKITYPATPKSSANPKSLANSKSLAATSEPTTSQDLRPTLPLSPPISPPISRRPRINLLRRASRTQSRLKVSYPPAKGQ